MTIDQALTEAAKYMDRNLLPAKRTVYHWIKKGAISPADPIQRISGGKRCRKNTAYPVSLPFEIAAVTYFHKIEKKKITDIACYRTTAEEMRANQKYLIGENAVLGANWLFWLIKFSNGYYYKKPVSVVFEKRIHGDSGRIEIKEIIEESVEDRISLRTGRFTDTGEAE